jgi:uncharacterized membrane protein YgdD (TMEM256/DUF423 family)
MLNQTVLNPDFVVSQVDRLDISSLANDMLGEQTTQEGEFAVKALEDTITDLKPWLADAVHSAYDYLEGRSQSLVIQLEPVKQSLRENMWQAFLQSPPPELAGLSPAEKEQYFNQSYQQFSQGIPSTFEVNEASLGAGGMASLEQARQYIGYFQLLYTALIGFILLLILLIIVIHHQVRGSTRGIGINFLICGILIFAGALLAKIVASPLMVQAGMPDYIKTWLPQLLADTLAPLQIYGIVLLAIGVVLLIVSFAYKPRQASF